MSEFDLDRCMKDGGKCLAGDRPARVICTDVEGRNSVLALVTIDDVEAPKLYTREGRNAQLKSVSHNDLRNLPEYKEVDVTLWVSGYDCVERLTFFGDQPHGPPGANWQPYGPPVKVRFER